MPKTMRNKEETTQYLSDKENMNRFIHSLHDYLRKHMKYTIDEDGKKSWSCNYDRTDTDRELRIKHFIIFCNKMCLNWAAADDLFQYAPDDHWCMCDCDYLYGLRIDDDGIAYYVDR